LLKKKGWAGCEIRSSLGMVISGLSDHRLLLH
jgi:hypothetical protein